MSTVFGPACASPRRTARAGGVPRGSEPPISFFFLPTLDFAKLDDNLKEPWQTVAQRADPHSRDLEQRVERHPAVRRIILRRVLSLSIPSDTASPSNIGPIDSANDAAARGFSGGLPRISVLLMPSGPTIARDRGQSTRPKETSRDHEGGTLRLERILAASAPSDSRGLTVYPRGC